MTPISFEPHSKRHRESTQKNPKKSKKIPRFATSRTRTCDCDAATNSLARATTVIFRGGEPTTFTSFAHVVPMPRATVAETLISADYIWIITCMNSAAANLRWFSYKPHLAFYSYYIILYKVTFVQGESENYSPHKKNSSHHLDMSEPIPSLPAQAQPTNEEDRKAAAALSSLDAQDHSDEDNEHGSKPSKAANIDQEALALAISRLEMSAKGKERNDEGRGKGKAVDGDVEEDARKRVKVDPADVALLVGMEGRRWDDIKLIAEMMRLAMLI